MNEALKKFLFTNAYQLIATFIGLFIVITGFYVSLQLFEQSINSRVQAVETTQAAQQALITQSTNQQSNILITQSSEAQKISDMAKDVRDIKTFLLNSK